MRNNGTRQNYQRSLDDERRPCKSQNASFIVFVYIDSIAGDFVEYDAVAFPDFLLQGLLIECRRLDLLLSTLVLALSLTADSAYFQFLATALAILQRIFFSAFQSFALELIMVSISNSLLCILRALRDEPWLTADQLVRWVQRSSTRLYADLQALLKLRMVQRLNPRCARLDLRALYALTDLGVKMLAVQTSVDERTYSQRYAISRARHVEILWRIEMVCAVRDCLLESARGENSVQAVRTLVHEAYFYRMKQSTIKLDGRARLVDKNGSALRIVVEWDNERLRLDAQRLLRLGEWLWQFREWEPERDLPALLFVLANDTRLQEFWELLHTRMEFGGNLRAALLLTTRAHLRERGMNAPVWFSVEQNAWRTFTEGQAWLPAEECRFHWIGNARSGRIGHFSLSSKRVETVRGLEHLLALNLALSAQAKRVLLRIATRPLLSVEQLAWIMQAHPDRVSKALQELARARLVEGIAHQRTRRYMPTPLGTRYEAAEMGFGRAVKRYLKRTGGRSGIKRLVFHLEHTIATNDFFLAWIKLARERAVRFEWFSEIESTRYFKYGSQWHRFLPDGRGVWHGAGEAFRFVVEIDRTRESAVNLRNKFNEYFYWQMWRMSQCHAEPDPHVLVVTTSWTQAEHIFRLVEKARRKIFPRYPLWVTTFEALQTDKLVERIWQSNLREPGLHYLPCFEGVRT